MLSIADLTDWMDENTGPQVFWYVKRLSGNDTLANGTHQAGPYIPREVLFKIFPSMNRPLVENPNKWFDLRIDSHGDARNVRAVWYNSKVRNAGTRNETRLTNFGGAESALLDPESTGSLAIFAFHRGDDVAASDARTLLTLLQIRQVTEDASSPNHGVRLVAELLEGRANGSWTGTSGITSSTAAA